jgi:hypothetical protein
MEISLKYIHRSQDLFPFCSPSLLCPRTNLIITPTNMNRTRAIRTQVMIEHKVLALTFQCRIAAAHDRIFQVVDAVIVVTAQIFIDR